MLKRIFAAISALLTILFAALGVQWIDRSRKNHWDLPRLGIGLIWLSSTVWQFLSTCSLWQMASQEADEDEFNDFDDFEIITD